MNEKCASAARWFRATVFIGIAVNLVLSVPGMFWPNQLLAFTNSPLALDTPVWPASSSMLLILLSLFYIPGALDPLRYRWTAIMTLVARASGSTFFLLIWRGEFPLIGWIDLFFLIIQTPFLILTFRRASLP